MPSAQSAPLAGARFQPERIYWPRPGRRIATLGLLAVLGAILSVLALRHLHLGQLPLPRAVCAVPAAVCWLAALGSAVTLLRGTPRVVLDGRGITLTLTFGSRYVGWSDLAPLSWSPSGALTVQGLPWDGRPEQFTIADIYDVPVQTIARRIEQYRTDIVGVARFGAMQGDGSAGGGSFEQAWWSDFADRRNETAWATLAIVAVLILAYVLEVRFAVVAGADGTQSPASMLALGGIERDYVLRNNEWWRVLTGTLLHINRLHLITNLFVLVLAGWVLERVVGPAWLLAVYLLGGLGGALATLGFAPAHLVSVGASGAIMAVMACGFCLALRMPPGGLRRLMMWLTLLCLIPSLLPARAAAHSGVLVDVSAHIGGAIVGAITGLLLHGKFEESTQEDSGRQLALVIACCLGLLSFASVGAVAMRVPTFQKVLDDQMAQFIPQARWPTDPEQLRAAGPGLLSDYPKDPRSHVAMALFHIHNNDMLDADGELHEALRMVEHLPAGPGTAKFVNLVRGVLGPVLLQMHDRETAIEQVRPVCQAPPDEQPDARLMTVLHTTGLCP